MIYTLRLHTVDPAHVSQFLAAFRNDGLWCELSRGLKPDHIGTDVLQSHAHPWCFLSIDFWLSEDAYWRAQRSAEVLTLTLFLLNLTTSYESLGVCSFPPRTAEEDRRV